MPDDKPTRELEQTEIIKGLLKSLERTVQSGFQEVKAEIQEVRDEARTANAKLDGRVEHLETRASTTSDRVKQNSEQDLTAQRQLAEEIAARQNLERKVDDLLSIGGRLEAHAGKLISNPWIRLIFFVVASALATKYGVKYLPGTTTPPTP